jgi:excisionase family DNA binding protein
MGAQTSTRTRPVGRYGEDITEPPINQEVSMQAMTKKVLSSAEFAQAVGTGVNRIRAYVRTGKIRAVRYGRRIVIPLSEVDKFLSNEATARVQA